MNSVLSNDIKPLCAEAVFNDQKIEEFVNSLLPDYQAGKLTIEEIKQAFIDNLINFVDINTVSKKDKSSIKYPEEYPLKMVDGS